VCIQLELGNPNTGFHELAQNCSSVSQQRRGKAWFQFWCLILVQPFITTAAKHFVQTSTFHIKNTFFRSCALQNSRQSQSSTVLKVYNLARFSWWPLQVFTGVQLQTRIFTHGVFPKNVTTKSVSWETMFFLATVLK